MIALTLFAALELVIITRLVFMLRAQLRRPTTLINARLTEHKLTPDLPRRQRRALARQK